MQVTDRPTQVQAEEKTPPQQSRRQPLDTRQLVPELGYRNYWYPALQSSALRRRPVYAKLLGDEIVVWRDARTRQPYALSAWCPHRGAPLWKGKQHFPGTISCPYHGWTLDGRGACRAVLSEGPDSPMPGKARTRAYRARELRGLIWIWMGDGEPVPLEQDVPPEFLDPQTELYVERDVWACNWRPTMDNPGDSHPTYLHRTSLQMLFVKMPAWERKEVETFERSVGTRRVRSGEQATYPGLGKYPAHLWWRVLKSSRKQYSDAPVRQELVLPCWIRVDMGSFMYTRFAVPVDANTTLNFQVAARRVTTARERLQYAVFCQTWVKHFFFGNFSGQDKWLLEMLNYEQPEKLAVTDACLIQWRRLSARARGSQAAGEEAHGQNGHAEQPVMHAAAPDAERVSEEPEETTETGLA